MSEGGHWYGKLGTINRAMVNEWVERAVKHVSASPEDHCAALVDAAVNAGALQPVGDGASDGYHTIGELYWHRLLLTAALFRELHHSDHDLVNPPDLADQIAPHKSPFHSDGELPFGGGWFIVVAQLPTGQISYHYQLKHWDLFPIPARDRAAEWDGHSADDVAARLRSFLEAS